MKMRLHTLMLMWTLVTGLLFSQVGAGYFHNKHDAHKNTHILASGHYAIQAHGEHCKLCAIDLFQLFSETSACCEFEESAKGVFIVNIQGNPSTPAKLLKGRSPPFIV